jgi:hypothetical protein
MGRPSGSTRVSTDHLLEQKKHFQEKYKIKVKDNIKLSKSIYKQHIDELSKILPFSMTCSGQSLKIILTLEDIEKFKSLLK